jgi:hypothetical protein
LLGWIVLRRAIRFIKCLQTAGVGLKQFINENVPAADIGKLKSPLDCNAVFARCGLGCVGSRNMQEEKRCPFGM